MTEIIDSYSESNFDSTAFTIQTVHPSSITRVSAVGQCFITPATPQYKLNYAQFYLKRNGGQVYARACVYDITGTFGSSGIPTEPALATSDLVNTLDIDSGIFNLITFQFSGVNKITLVTNTAYCIVIEADSGVWNTTNYVFVGFDHSSPSHPGNAFRYFSSAWTVLSSTYDALFYVYGDEVAGKAGSSIIPIMVAMGMLQ